MTKPTEPSLHEQCRYALKAEAATHSHGRMRQMLSLSKTSNIISPATRIGQVSQKSSAKLSTLLTGRPCPLYVGSSNAGRVCDVGCASGPCILVQSCEKNCEKNQSSNMSPHWFVGWCSSDSGQWALRMPSAWKSFPASMVACAMLSGPRMGAANRLWIVVNR